MRNYIMKLVSAISFILFFLLYSCTNTNESKQLNDALLIKTDSLNILNKKIDSLAKHNDSLLYELNYWFSDEEVDRLKEQHISDPQNDITKKLYDNQKPPYPGVLGGTMRFGKMTLLKDRWVIAEFDDGHVVGTALYRYSVQKDTSLKWTIMDKFME